jgi:mannose-6-phosphate isomerase-like protein (cupin superfamily)
MRATAEPSRHDSTVVKIDSSRSPRGKHGEKYLASGVRVALRLWEDEEPGETPETERAYEVVGYVIDGRAELHTEGQIVTLSAGDSYVVPRGSRHHYRILERFTAVEATSPPAQVHGRDEESPVERERTRGGGFSPVVDADDAPAETGATSEMAPASDNFDGM